MDLGSRSRIVKVTGSSQEVDQAFAFGLAQEGARVVLCARNDARLRDTSKEITDLVVFLASERASHITGAVIQVDGGLIRSLI